MDIFFFLILVFAAMAIVPLTVANSRLQRKVFELQDSIRKSQLIARDAQIERDGLRKQLAKFDGRKRRRGAKGRFLGDDEAGVAARTGKTGGSDTAARTQRK